MKKIILITLCAIFMFALNGCGNKKVEQSADNKTNNKVEVSKKEDNKKEEPKFEVINKEKVNIIDNYCEFTIKDSKFGKKVVPPKPEQFYTYYEAKEQGTTYFDVVINVKSLLTEGQSSDKFLNVKVIYDEKYEYKTFSAIEDKGGSDFTFTNITPIEPLKSGMVHFIAEVPEEVEKAQKPLVVVINSNGKEFRYSFK